MQRLWSRVECVAFALVPLRAAFAYTCYYMTCQPEALVRAFVFGLRAHAAQLEGAGMAYNVEGYKAFLSF
jgi:hypothetical protein